MWIQSLVWELRFYMLCSAAKKKFLRGKKKSLFFTFFFCIGVELINYVVIVSGEQ